MYSIEDTQYRYCPKIINMYKIQKNVHDTYII